MKSAGNKKSFDGIKRCDVTIVCIFITICSDDISKVLWRRMQWMLFAKAREMSNFK